MAYKTNVIFLRGTYTLDHNHHDHYSVRTYLDDSEQASHKGLRTTSEEGCSSCAP